MKIRYVLGIDEAGRGPLAGPVAVGAALVPVDFDWEVIPGVGDSKKVSEKKREEIFKRAHALKKEGVLDFNVQLVSASVIDRIGITKAVMLGIKRACEGLAPDPLTTSVKLDGLLHAPEKFLIQETIIKGDAKEKVIGLASILAKVTRDRYMIRLAKKYPLYGFEIHKGYGTLTHRTMLHAHGLSEVHRMSFCRGYTR